MPEPAPPGAPLRLRALRANERDALPRFIAQLNQPGPQHCLHLADSEAGVRADIQRMDADACDIFCVAEDATGWRGAAGLDRDGDLAWLLGPWAVDVGDSTTRATLLQAVLAAPGLAQVRAFGDLRGAEVLDELVAVGFVRHSEVHVMTAPRHAWTDSGLAGTQVAIGEAADGDEPALAALHRAAFPQTWLGADELLAHARKLGVMLVARDAAQRLLGSLCLTFNAALPETDVEFLAVQPHARGRGVGRALLQAALRRSFVAEARETVNLCVNDINVDALRLYEKCGFKRLHSGASLRWLAEGEEPAASAQST